MSALASVARKAPEGASGAQGVVVEAGLSEQALVALRTLHRAWALEEHGKPMNEEAWHHQAMGLACSGLWVPLVAWDGDYPVGCVELYLHHDPLQDVLIAHGDRAFVAANYRGEGVFRALYDAVSACAVALGAGKLMVPVGVDSTGLRRFYEVDGYELSGYTLRKKVT